jgi:hypothetical protein
MRIDGRYGPAPLAATGARRPASGGFSVSGGSEAREAGPAGAATALHSIDALVILQGEEDAGQRRRRAARRGRDLLDALDGLKAAILAGRIAPDRLLRLRSILAERRLETDDPRLDDLLGHIELRAEVELAKLTQARARAIADPQRG